MKMDKTVGRSANENLPAATRSYARQSVVSLQAHRLATVATSENFAAACLKDGSKTTSVRVARQPRLHRAGGTPAPQGRRRRGLVVFLVMIVIMMVTLAGLSYVLTLSTENRAVHLHGDQLQLDEALVSGQEYIRAVCSGPPEQRDERGDLSDNETLFRQIVLDCDPQGLRSARISIVSPQYGERGTSAYRFGLQDESAKLNLAVLQQWERSDPGAAERALMNLPGMTESTAASILDWIDPDTVARPSGAEADYYAGRGLPYVPRDGVPASLEELLLVRDVGRYQLLGADTDMNYTIDDREIQAASAMPLGGAAATSQPWATLLTMYSAERNVTFDGQPRIDLNQDDLDSLYDELEEALDRERAEFIIAYRQFGPYEVRGTREFATPRGTTRFKPAARSAPASRSGKAPRQPRRDGAGSWFDLSRPAEFEIDSVFDLIGAQVLLPPAEEPERDAAARRQKNRRGTTVAKPASREANADDEAEPQIIASPFEADPAAMGDYLAELLDRTTVDLSPIIRGRINVHLAPREVLAAIPEVEPETIDRILSGRLSHDGDEPTIAHRHATWLVTEAIVDPAQMKQLAPYLTGGGDVFRGQIVAALDDSPLQARAEVVIDSTTSPPRQVYWKNLGLLGRGFPPEVVGSALPASE